MFITKREKYFGRLEYTAPERLKNKDCLAEKSGDLWALGILLYEMFHKYAPFRDNDLNNLFLKISNKSEISFGDNISTDAIDLINRLLIIDAKQRISFDEIYEHPWIKKFEVYYELNIQLFKTGLETNEKENKKFDSENEFSPERSPKKKFQKKLHKVLTKKEISKR